MGSKSRGASSWAENQRFDCGPKICWTLGENAYRDCMGSLFNVPSSGNDTKRSYCGPVTNRNL